MEQSTSGFRLALITLLAIICAFLSIMGMLIVNVALLIIKSDFGISFDQTTWIITPYSLAFMVIIPFSSGFSALLGRKNYFIMAVMLFMVGSFFCGNATGIHELIIFRFLQGLGGGAMLVLSHTIITESWPVKRRATSQAFFVLGMVAAVTMAGPIGGYLADDFSWPYIFFVNIPLGIIVCLLILTAVRNVSYEKKEDWLGIVMLTIGGSSLYFVLEKLQHLSIPYIIVLFIVGLTGIILFIWRQFSQLHVNLRKGMLLAFITSFGTAAASVIMAASLKSGAHPPIALSTNIPVIILMLVITVIFIEQVGALKYLIATGMLLWIIHCYLLYQMPSGSTLYMYWLLIVPGLATALLSVPVSTLAFSKLEGKEMGEGVALYNIMRQLGTIAGLAFFYGLFHF